VPEKLLRGDSEILDDLTKKSRLDVSAAVNRQGRGAAIFVPKLLVGPSLPDFDQAQSPKNDRGFRGAERPHPQPGTPRKP